MSETMLNTGFEQFVAENLEHVRETCARRFDDTCRPWTKDPRYNRMFLREQERYANDLLRARGYLFLNEVYEMLGMVKTKFGQVAGWTWRENAKVEFNIPDMITLDDNLLKFNIDGVILDQLKD